ncbi:hypothetical protein ACFQDE_10165 [Deinococcus caeni]|uniref:hypothetical protein n=1 Tax=Deinococcus caeni TaxID=569127 RepID=UPI00360C8383
MADVGSLNPGQTADLLVRVTFPAGSAPTTPGTQPTVTVTTTSSNDTTKKDTTKDIVNLPGLSFGNPTPPPAVTPPRSVRPNWANPATPARRSSRPPPAPRPPRPSAPRSPWRSPTWAARPTPSTSAAWRPSG